MTSELGANARALIDQACNEEAAPPHSELERIRKNVVTGAVSSAVMLAAPHAAGFVGGTTPLALVVLALKGGAAGTLVALAAFGADRWFASPGPRDAAGAHDAAPAIVRAAPVRTAPSRHTAVPALPAPPGPEGETSALRASTGEPRIGAAIRAEASSRPASGAGVGSLEASAALHEETALLKRVQQELRAGRGVEALRLLDASSARLERGQLRQERLAAEVLAACQAGELERARRSARAFAAENPATPSAARLRASCVGSEFFEDR
jgi:hypothetical protein